jgi:hypothetical protein
MQLNEISQFSWVESDGKLKEIKSILIDICEFYNEESNYIENLKGINLTEEILFQIGFINCSDDGYSYELFKPVFANEVNVIDGVIFKQEVMIKPATFLIIKLDGSNGRYTTLLKSGENKLYISEHSFVHEAQKTISALTFKTKRIKLA